MPPRRISALCLTAFASALIGCDGDSPPAPLGVHVAEVEPQTLPLSQPATVRAQRNLVLTSTTKGNTPGLRWLLTDPNGRSVGIDGASKLVTDAGLISSYKTSPQPCGPAPDCRANSTRSEIAQPIAGLYELDIVSMSNGPLGVNIDASDISSGTQSTLEIPAEPLAIGAHRVVRFTLRFDPATDLRAAN